MVFSDRMTARWSGAQTVILSLALKVALAVASGALATACVNPLRGISIILVVFLQYLNRYAVWKMVLNISKEAKIQLPVGH